MNMDGNHKNEYISRINRVIDYIENNLSSELSLKKLSSIANFSPYHFHRIFSSIVGEPLNCFIQRLRIERAASHILLDRQKTITEIALNCGFSSSSSFARLFKEVYGINASELRKSKIKYEIKLEEINSKNRIALSKNRKEWEISTSYFGSTIHNKIWSVKMKKGRKANVEGKELPEMNVAYVRHIGPYKGNPELFEKLFTKLMTWAGPRGLINFPESKVLAVYHDDPSVTDESKLRLSACLSVPKDTEVNGEIGKMTIIGGKYAVAKFELANDEYPEAWELVYGGWLPQSGYQCVDAPCFENYLNDPKEHPEGKCIVEICVPVKPM